MFFIIMFSFMLAALAWHYRMIIRIRTADALIYVAERLLNFKTQSK